MQDIKEGNRDESEVAKVDGLLHSSADGLQDAQLFRTEEDGVTTPVGLAGCFGDCQDQSWSGLLHGESVTSTILRDERHQKIAEAESRPGELAGKFFALLELIADWFPLDLV